MIWFWLFVAFVFIILGIFIFSQGGKNLGPAVSTIGVVILLILMVSPSRGQESHGHTPQDMELHRKFYSTWMMPDNRHVSCCHDQDCSPAQAKNVNGTWYARKEDGDDWIEIPRNKVDIGLPDSRDPPDSRAHLCGRKYTFMGSSGGFTVFCFTAGAGG